MTTGSVDRPIGCRRAGQISNFSALWMYTCIPQAHSIPFVPNPANPCKWLADSSLLTRAALDQVRISPLPSYSSQSTLEIRSMLSTRLTATVKGGAGQQLLGNPGPSELVEAPAPTTFLIAGLVIGKNGSAVAVNRQEKLLTLDARLR